MFGPVRMPEASVKAAGDVFGIMSGPSADGRDDAQHAEFFEQKLLMVLAVEAAVAGQGLEAMTIVRLLGRLMEAWIIR